MLGFLVFVVVKFMDSCWPGLVTLRFFRWYPGRNGGKGNPVFLRSINFYVIGVTAVIPITFRPTNH